MVPEDVKRRIDQQEVECIDISAEDVQKAFRNKPVDEYFTKAGRLKCKLGDARRDFSLLCLAHPRHVKVVPAVDELRLSGEKFAKAKSALEALLHQGNSQFYSSYQSLAVCNHAPGSFLSISHTYCIVPGTQSCRGQDQDQAFSFWTED